MSPTFSTSTLSHSYKFCIFLDLLNSKSTTIREPTSYPAYKLMKHILQRPTIRYIPFYSFSIITFFICLLSPHSLIFCYISTQTCHSSKYLHELPFFVHNLKGLQKLPFQDFLHNLQPIYQA